jgi:hypothetical protein
MFTVVCILTDGSVIRSERRTLAEAQERMDELEQLGRFASGSIFNEDDEELISIAAA